MGHLCSVLDGKTSMTTGSWDYGSGVKNSNLSCITLALSLELNCWKFRKAHLQIWVVCWIDDLWKVCKIGDTKSVWSGLLVETWPLGSIHNIPSSGVRFHCDCCSECALHAARTSNANVPSNRGSSTAMNFYTDDQPGLKMSPVRTLKSAWSPVCVCMSSCSGCLTNRLNES